MNFLSQKQDIRQPKTLYQYNAPNGVMYIGVRECRYRKTDDTLIIVMNELIPVKITNSLSLIDILLQICRNTTEM